MARQRAHRGARAVSCPREVRGREARGRAVLRPGETQTRTVWEAAGNRLIRRARKTPGH